MKFHIAEPDSILEKLRTTRKITISGLHGSCLSLFISELVEKSETILFIVRLGQEERFLHELKRLVSDTVSVDEENPFYVSAKIIITTKDFVDRAIGVKEKVKLKRHEALDLTTLLNKLEASGYSREDIVEEEKEYALRGGILDFFAQENFPVRVELYGDKIFSLRRFDTQTQRSVEQLESVNIALARLHYTKKLSDLIDKNRLIISEEDLSLDFPLIMLADQGEVQYHFTPPRKYFGDFAALRADLARKDFSFRFFVPDAIAEKLRSIIGIIETYNIPIEEGFVNEDEHIVYLTETEIFGEIKRKKRVYKGLFVDDLMGLKENDFVVHTDYGIGQFKGLVFMDFENRKVECLRLDYAQGDKVYLPVESLNLLERYVAGGDRLPKLSKLGSELWLKTKVRVKRATERLAIDLLRLYSQRMNERGFAFSPDTFEMSALEATFPYEETEDQLKALKEVRKDMEASRPAERLICGDVGYGKTEIALRTAFKSACDSKQTMILCPTTLLAFQHYNTFKKRLEPFPVRVEMVSRFRKDQEIKEVLKDVETGKVDIVIGTHRLLQPDVQFPKLGLLIIDEEQRFGVMQKEKIKNLKPGIDVLYLSATPIPRTLYMSLTGLKDISNIYTPPMGRKDISTKIIYYDDDEIKRIIEFELERNGQIFFVHNRIQTIESVKSRLQRILPSLRITVLHGQMREDITARHMVSFLQGEYDLLLSTAIVESGLDMPRVNTIIVDEAHKFGLADLHQLRGRVGRSDVQAYAYFIIPHRYNITEQANQRLGALVSYTSLGSGFRLALRDMEIRGVGNLLGKEQSGNINAIGYHHYIKVLSESVSELQGRRVFHEPILDLKLEAYFPSQFIESPYERTALYKRLLDVESKFELGLIKNEIIDRFGKYPEQVENLFLLSEIRLEAKHLGAAEVLRKESEFVFYKEGKVVSRRKYLIEQN